MIRVGDKIRLTRKPNDIDVYGVVTDIEYHQFSDDPLRYFVEYEGDFIPPYAWHEEYQIALEATYFDRFKHLKCECGYGNEPGITHMPYCQIYKAQNG